MNYKAFWLLFLFFVVPGGEHLLAQSNYVFSGTVEDNEGVIP
jgi:hypothetical protein